MPKTRKIESEVTPGTGAAAPAPVRRRTAAARSTTRKPAVNRAAKPAPGVEDAEPVMESVAEFLEPVEIETVEVETVVVAVALEPTGALDPTHEQISALAYSYWVNRGYQAGNPREDWLRAERELRGLA